MVDNFEKIIELIKGRASIDEFFFLQIFKRRKDNPGMEKDMILIDNFFIKNEEDLVKKQERIKEICIQNNARAYFRLNRRSYKKVALQTLRIIADSISTENYHIENCYLSSCGQYHSDPRKTWILDIDRKEGESEAIFNSSIDDIIKRIFDLEPVGEKMVSILPTKNGVHIICLPFNLEKLESAYNYISIHRDNPTILYIPNSTL